MKDCPWCKGTGKVDLTKTEKETLARKDFNYFLLNGKIVTRDGGALKRKIYSEFLKNQKEVIEIYGASKTRSRNLINKAKRFLSYGSIKEKGAHFSVTDRRILLALIVLKLEREPWTIKNI